MDPLSDKHPLLKQIRRAVSRGTLTDDGYAVIESPHLLDEALAAKCEIGVVLVSQSAWGKHAIASFPASTRGPLEDKDEPAIFQRGEDSQTDPRLISDKIFQQLSSTESPQGLLALVRPPVWSLEQMTAAENPLLVILDRLQDPGNAGAILRAAEAFGATGAVFLKGTVNPYNPKCLRGSAGSVFRLPLVTGVDESQLLDAIAEQNLSLFAAMPRAETLLHESDLVLPCAIVIGSEGQGVSTVLAERAIGLRIPTTGVESLNASVAAGILLYECRRQRDQMGTIAVSAKIRMTPKP